MSACKDPEMEELHRKRLSDAMKGHKNCLGHRQSETHRKNISLSLEGNKCSLGHQHTTETRERIGHAQKGHKHRLFGKHLPKEIRIRISESLSGEKSPNWKGGISFEPYCVKFNREFKNRVRAFFGYRCIECGSSQNGDLLDVHHVNFNKKSCCDESIPLFVPLCHSCHSKTGHDRDYWKQHFTEIINRDYRGKCYLTKDEMARHMPDVPGWA